MSFQDMYIYIQTDIYNICTTLTPTESKDIYLNMSDIMTFTNLQGKCCK